MILVISGKARSGKDTFAKMLARELQKQTGKAYVLMAYAHKLKTMIQKDFDLSYAQLWGDEKEIEDKRYKQADPGMSGMAVRYAHDDRRAAKLPPHYWTAREIMQNYGQFFRTIDYNFWVRELFNTIEEREYKNVIITDGRHRNEINAVVDRGGYHIRVQRENKDSVHNEQHISETALDSSHEVDFNVINNWTLKELKVAAEDVAKFLIKINKKEK